MNNSFKPSRPVYTNKLNLTFWDKRDDPRDSLVSILESSVDHLKELEKCGLRKVFSLLVTSICQPAGKYAHFGANLRFQYVFFSVNKRDSAVESRLPTAKRWWSRCSHPNKFNACLPGRKIQLKFSPNAPHIRYCA